MDRGSFWGSSRAFFQTDGYAAYDQIGGLHMVHAAGWAHSEAMQLNPKDLVATRIVARMDELFAIDAEARLQIVADIPAQHVIAERRLLDVVSCGVVTLNEFLKWHEKLFARKYRDRLERPENGRREVVNYSLDLKLLRSHSIPSWKSCKNYFLTWFRRTRTE
jgi:hypothetical protein